MSTFVEGTFEFAFPTSIGVSKYDDSPFYRNQFSRCQPKGVDFVAVEPSRGVLWLLEVKDYRVHRRTKPTDLGDEMRQKVLDTLAGLLTAGIYRVDGVLAREALKCQEVRVVLHLELPKAPRNAVNPSSIALKLKQLLKPVCAHPKVVSIESPGNLPWTVTRTAQEGSHQGR